MPTTEPLDPGDDAGGQLKPIAEFKSEVRTGTVPRATTPTDARKNSVSPNTPPAPQPPSIQKSPLQPMAGTHLKTTLRTPGIGLRGTPKKVENTPTTPVKGQHVERTSPFTPDNLTREWQRFIDSNGAEHLLVNAMRAAMPKHAHDNVYVVTQSEVHIALIREHLERLTTYLHNALDNDSVSLELNIVSEDSPLAWNDREFIAHVIDDNPTIAEFIDMLKLSLI